MVKRCRVASRTTVPPLSRRAKPRGAVDAGPGPTVKAPGGADGMRSPRHAKHISSALRIGGRAMAYSSGVAKPTIIAPSRSERMPSRERATFFPVWHQAVFETSGDRCDPYHIHQSRSARGRRKDKTGYKGPWVSDRELAPPRSARSDRAACGRGQSQWRGASGGTPRFHPIS